MPDAASLERTAEVTAKVERIALETPGVAHTVAIPGQSFVLNAFSPGSGDSRAYDASANFSITNGVLMSDDLVVHSTGFRLNYSGAIDGFTKQVDARAEAQFLRDTRLLGPLLSTLLTPISKLFEYKITGSLKSPKIAPVYIPEPLMFLFRPFHTLKTLTESPSDSPPAAPPPQSTPPKK